MVHHNPYVLRLKRFADATDQELIHSWQVCAKITKRAAQNFFYAFLFLPRENRNGIYALYAFCRASDDAADDGHKNPISLIEELKEKLRNCYDGYYTDSITLALAATIKRFKLPRKHFEDLFLGLEADINGINIANFGDLKLYCYRVAVTVGLLCLHIFEYDDSTSRLYAEKIGYGMQLTNVLRDIGEDYRRQRIYLPHEDMEKFGLNRANFFDSVNSGKLQRLVEWEGKRANTYFKEADSLYGNGLPSKLKVAGIMAAFYREILKMVVKNDRSSGRPTLTRRQKLSIAYKAMLA